MAKRWTEEEDNKLIKLREEGFTYREIAIRLQRTEGAVRTRAQQVLDKNQIRKRWSEEEKALAIELRSTSHSVKHIAYRLGRTPKAVSSFFYLLDNEKPDLSDN